MFIVWGLPWVVAVGRFKVRCARVLVGVWEIAESGFDKRYGIGLSLGAGTVGSFNGAIRGSVGDLRGMLGVGFPGSCGSFLLGAGNNDVPGSGAGRVILGGVKGVVGVSVLCKIGASGSYFSVRC